MAVDGFTLGNVLSVVQILSILFGGGLVAFRLGRTTATMQTSLAGQNLAIDDLKAEIKKLGDVLTKLAVQEQRLNMLDKHIDELRHGEGFVYPFGSHLNKATG